ncbi:MAG: leucine-rich repeat protein, partial [Oscillospiraceae bacterium]|nr:leucine-rich repeat protein [Oscillospiraceae bacterium]
MPDKKFKLSKKHGLYAVAGAALVGSLAAAVITSPDILHSVFDPDKYSFSDMRKNGDVAYNASEGAGSSKGKDGDGNGTNSSDEAKNESLNEGKDEDKSTEAPKATNEPEKTKRDENKDNNISSQEESVKSGTDKGGYSNADTGKSTDKASSYDSTGEDLGEDSDIFVEVNKDDDTIDSVVPNYTPAPTKAPATPKPTQAPVITPRPAKTMAPTFEETKTSGGKNNKPDVTEKPAQTEAPQVTAVPTAEPTKEPEITKEPMPTEVPEPSKPSEIVKENEAAGNEVQVSKGEIGITNHTGGGSVTSGGATKIDFTSFKGDQSEVEYIQISSSIKKIDFETAKVLFPNLKGYVVSEKNKYFKSVDGVLYSKDGTILYACPAQAEEITEFPEELTTIYAGAFMGSAMENLTLPDTVTQVGENAFAEAAIGTLTFTAQDVNLGATVFYNLSDDGLSVKKLVFNSTTPPTVDDNSALKFKNAHSGLDTSGMIIEVPDSKNDEVLCAYMKAWGETIDGLYGSGMTSYLFNTAGNAGGKYSYENKALYRKIEADGEEAKYSGYELLYVAPSTEGEFTPAYDTKVICKDAFSKCDKITAINIPSSVEALEDGCFAGLDKLTSIMLSGTAPVKTSAEVWKDINPDEVKIYVYPDALEAYLESWGPVLDDL